MSKTIIFDIETGPLPEAELLPFMPTEWPLGNLKDPEKIKLAVAEKKKAWTEGAALDPLTGRVLLISMLVDSTFVHIAEPGTEAMMLHEFWDSIQDRSNIHRLIGFSSNKFDLPFLVKRSWKHNVPVPQALFSGHARYPWSSQVVDLREHWQLGDYQCSGSLDTISKHLGIGAKSGSGADFAALWEKDRAKALEYAKQDLRLTEGLARAFRVIL